MGTDDESGSESKTLKCRDPHGFARLLECGTLSNHCPRNLVQSPALSGSMIAIKAAILSVLRIFQRPVMAFEVLQCSSVKWPLRFRAQDERSQKVGRSC